MASVQVYRVDDRGNRWFKSKAKNAHVDKMEEVLNRWMVAPQQDCDRVKLEAFQVFDIPITQDTNLKGMPGKEFFYVYDASMGNKHVFVCTKGAQKGSAFCYEGECDMHFASCAGWELIEAQAQCM